MQPKLIRITTVPQSLVKLLEGQLQFMNEYYEVIAISGDDERMQKIVRSEGVRAYTVELTRKITPFKDLIAVYRLYRILKKEKPLFVHTHTPKAGIVGMLAAFLARVPHRLHTVAGMPLLVAVGKRRKLLDFVEKLTYKLATKVYPNSYGLSDIILELNFTNPEKLKVIGNGSSNGIDTNYFDTTLYLEEGNRILKNELNIAENDFVFIFVGRIVGDKGVNELVMAFDKLSQEKNNVKLLLVGSEEKDLDPIAEKSQKIIKTNRAIVSVGYQDDVRPYLAVSNVLALPSYREGFPNVVMQAGAMRLPAIVTDINGCNEIIQDGVNGAVISVKRSDLLYERMKWFMDLPTEELKEMGRGARSEIMKKYDRQFVWECILREYKSFEEK